MSFYSSSSFSTSGAVDSNGDPDLLYYNAQIINNKSNTPETYEDDPPAVFTDIRSRPLINNVSNFDFSIMRFDMNGSGKKLPLFIPEIETQYDRNPSFDVNQTVYTVGATLNFNYKLTAGGASLFKSFYQSVPIIFNPENLNTLKPNKPNYPYGIQFIDTNLPTNGLDYQYFNKSYKCVNTPSPADAFSNEYNNSNKYNIGDIIYRPSITTLARSKINNNSATIPTSSNASWDVITQFNPNLNPGSSIPPYPFNSYVYSSNTTITVKPDFVNSNIEIWESAVSSQVNDLVLYNNKVYKCNLFVPQYSSLTDYDEDDLVIFGGDLFEAKNQPETFNNTSVYIPTNKVIYQGYVYTATAQLPAYWSSTQTYSANQKVSYNGFIYSSKNNANNNELPTQTLYWDQVNSYVPSNGSLYWTQGSLSNPTNTSLWSFISQATPALSDEIFSLIGIYADLNVVNNVFYNTTVIPNYWQSGTYGNGSIVSYQGNIYKNLSGSNITLAPPNNNWTLIGNYQLSNELYWSKVNIYLTPDLNFKDFATNTAPKTMLQNLSTNYYYISSYESFVYMINTALDLLWKNLSDEAQAFFLTLTPQPPTTTYSDVQYFAPYIAYDSSSGLFSLIGEQKYFIRGGKKPKPVGTQSSPTGWKYTPYPIDPNSADFADDIAPAPIGQWDPTFQLFFNENLWNLFSSFQTYRISNAYKSLLTYGTNYPTMYYIPIYDDGDNSYTPPSNVCESTLPPMFKMVQNYNTTSTLWSPVASIVFCSTLPLFSEEASAPQLYDNDSGPNGYISSSTAPFINSITDISVPLQSAQDYRGFVNYVPSGEYRMIATTGQGSAISNIEIQVFWRNRLDGRLYPVRLTNYSNISIKMLFRRKGHSTK